MTYCMPAARPRRRERAAVWQRFDELVNRMSNDQQAFVNGDEKALAKRQQLMTTFNDWLFERFKDEFVQIPAFAALAGEYVDVVAETLPFLLEKKRLWTTDCLPAFLR